MGLRLGAHNMWHMHGPSWPPPAGLPVEKCVFQRSNDMLPCAGVPSHQRHRPAAGIVLLIEEWMAISATGALQQLVLPSDSMRSNR